MVGKENNRGRNRSCPKSQVEINMNLNEMIKLSKLMSQEDVNVEIARDGRTAQCKRERDGTYTVTLPCLDGDVKWDKMTRGYLDHELGHVKFSEWGACKTSNENLRSVHNIFEDVYIEHEMGKEYPGSRKNMQALARNVFSPENAHATVSAMMDAWVNQNAMSTHQAVERLAMTYVLYKHRAAADSGLAESAQVLDDVKQALCHAYPGLAKSFAKIDREVLDIPSVSTAHAFSRARRVWDAISMMDVTPKENTDGDGQGNGESEEDGERQDSQDQAQQGKGQGSGNGEQQAGGPDDSAHESGGEQQQQEMAGSGTDAQGCDSESDSGDVGNEGGAGGQDGEAGEMSEDAQDVAGQSSGEEVCGGAKGDKGSGARTDSGADKSAGELMRELADRAAQEAAESKGVYTSGDMREAFNQAIEHEDVRVDEEAKTAGWSGVFDEANDLLAVSVDDGRREDILCVGEMAPPVRREVARLKSGLCRVIPPLLQSAQYKPVRVGYTGKLSTRHLSRLTTGDGRVFMRKAERIVQAVDVAMLLDMSGSMRGSEEPAHVALYGVLDMLKTLPHVRSCAAVYGGSQWKTLSKFTDNRVSRYEMRFGSSGTPTAGAILRMLPEFASSRDVRKMLFIITDGGPDDMFNFKQAMEMARQRGIEVYGLLIDYANKNFEDQFGKDRYVLVDSIGDLPRMLGDVMKKALLRMAA